MISNPFLWALISLFIVNILETNHSQALCARLSRPLYAHTPAFTLNTLFVRLSHIRCVRLRMSASACDANSAELMRVRYCVINEELNHLGLSNLMFVLTVNDIAITIFQNRKNLDYLESPLNRNIRVSHQMSGIKICHLVRIDMPPGKWGLYLFPEITSIC